MKKIVKHLFVFVVLCLITFSGCVSVPTETVSLQITPDELSQHVDFLAQPALRGRPARSWESEHVRRYLSQRLQQYGCVPWAENPSFELDFGFGKNIIGVLPGNDPQLKDEIVLISAHYDHLKPKLFSYYPGACDNASGVAALLEIAETLSLSEHRSRRSICFAFFDSEEDMCLGSFAFTCRDDYDDTQIAAVINLDLLGRDLLDVVDNCLITTGTENYADIQKQISAACSQNDLRYIPFESALVGPVGDHIAFTSSKRPVLFFTCGIYKDYHQPSDTPDKLNYAKMKKESAVIEQTLLALANAEPKRLESSAARVTDEKKDSFVYILSELKENSDALQLDPNDIKAIDELMVKLHGIDPNSITSAEMLNMERDALVELLKLYKVAGSPISQYSHAFLYISRLYAMQPEELSQAYRQMVRYYLDHRPSFWRDNKFAYQVNLPMTPQNWGIVKTGENEFLFGAVNTAISLQNKIHFLKGYEYGFMLNNKLTACKGSLPQIIDLVFLGKDPNGFTKEGHMAGHILGMDAKVENPGVLSEQELAERSKNLWIEFRNTLETDFPEETHTEAFQKYKDPNFSEAVAAASSGKRSFSGQIFITDWPWSESKPGKKRQKSDMVAYSVNTLLDTSEHIERRVVMINNLLYARNQAALSAVVDVLDDTTPYERKEQLITDPNFPLKDHPYVMDYRSSEEKEYQELKDKTLGQIAYERLKRISGEDFGTDKQVWKDWINKNFPK